VGQVSAAGDAALLARVLLSLIVVVLLAVLGARLARRMGLRAQGRGLHVLERLPLSREAFLAVVTVADRGLVLGVSAHGVRVLTELDGETLARVYPEPEEGAGAAGRRPGGLFGLRRAGRAGEGGGPGAGRARRGARRDDVAGVEVGPDGVKVTRLTGGAAPAPRRQGTGSVLDPRTWRQFVEALRDLTVRRG
jgi:flagellar biogenesis protein FliO